MIVKCDKCKINPVLKSVRWHSADGSRNISYAFNPPSGDDPNEYDLYWATFVRF